MQITQIILLSSTKLSIEFVGGERLVLLVSASEDDTDQRGRDLGDEFLRGSRRQLVPLVRRQGRIRTTAAELARLRQAAVTLSVHEQHLILGQIIREHQRREKARTLDDDFSR